MLVYQRVLLFIQIDVAEGTHLDRWVLSVSQHCWCGLQSSTWIIVSNHCQNIPVTTIVGRKSEVLADIRSKLSTAGQAIHGLQVSMAFHGSWKHTMTNHIHDIHVPHSVVICPHHPSAPCIILYHIWQSPPGRFLELTDAAAVVPMLPADRRSLDFGHQLKAKLKLQCQMTPMVWMVC